MVKGDLAPADEGVPAGIMLEFARTMREIPPMAATGEARNTTRQIIPPYHENAVVPNNFPHVMVHGPRVDKRCQSQVLSVISSMIDWPASRAPQNIDSTVKPPKPSHATCSAAFGRSTAANARNARPNITGIANRRCVVISSQRLRRSSGFMARSLDSMARISSCADRIRAGFHAHRST